MKTYALMSRKSRPKGHENQIQRMRLRRKINTFLPLSGHDSLRLTHTLRRHLSAWTGNAAALLLSVGPLPAHADDTNSTMQRQDPAAYAPDGRPLEIAVPRETVAFDADYAPGSIVVSTTERRLYYVLPDHQALRYGVGVGRPGFEWSGTKTIVAMWPISTIA